MIRLIAPKRSSLMMSMGRRQLAADGFSLDAHGLDCRSLDGRAPAAAPPQTPESDIRSDLHGARFAPAASLR